MRTNDRRRTGNLSARARRRLEELLADAQLLSELWEPCHDEWVETMRPFLLKKAHVLPLLASPPGRAIWVVEPQSYKQVSLLYPPGAHPVVPGQHRRSPPDIRDFGDLGMYEDDDALTTGDGEGHGDQWYVAEPGMIDALQSFVAQRRPRSWTNPGRKAPKNPAAPYPRGYEERGLDGRVWVVAVRSTGKYWLPLRR
jgi:hypothetical protein